MPLTPEDVRNKQFTTVRLREGYDEDEVDAFLDEVEAELTRLLRENEDLRAKLAAATRAAAQNQQNMRKPPEDQQQGQGMRGPGAPVPAGISGPPQQQMGGGPMGGPPQLPSGAPQLPPGPGGQGPGGPMGQGPGGPMGGPMQGMGPGGPMGGPMGPMGGPGGDSAARVLSLAQQTADQAIADARREADETMNRARREADEILAKSRRQAEQIIGDARARAETLERDAQERHRQAMGSLVQTRDELERKVEELRSFEREYRSRLKLYLENQLAELNVSAESSGGFPVVSGQMGGGGHAMPHPVAQPQIPSAPNPFAPDAPQHQGAFQGADGPHPDRR